MEKAPLKKATRAELNKKILVLAFPIMLSSLSQTLMSTLDTIMVGRLGQEALAAAGMGNIFILTFLFPLGMLSMGARIKIARRFGEAKYREIGRSFDNSLMLASILGVVFTILVAPRASLIMSIMNPDPVVGELAGVYVSIRFFAAVPFLFIMCIQGFFEGTSRTRITLYASVLVNSLNVIFNAILIFGLLGFPALGLFGAAWGSLLATLFGAIYLLSLACSPIEKSSFNLFRRANIDIGETKSILRLAIPTMLEGFGGILSYFIFVWIHGFISTTALAAASVLNAIYGLMFLPAHGLGNATGIVVGQALGQKQPEKAEKAAFQSIKMGFLFSSVVAVLGIIFASNILRVYTTDPEVVKLAHLPLLIVLVGSTLNSVGMVTRQAIIGAGMTVWAFRMQMIICYLLYLPVVYMLGVYLGLGITGTYIGEALYFIWVALIFYWKFRQGDWKLIEV